MTISIFRTQHREFHREIQQAKQVGVRGPNTENFIGKFNKQSKLGFGATQRISSGNSTSSKLGFGAPTQRISSGNSTSKASWGSGPQHREFHREIQQAKQVGVQTQRISSEIQQAKASWGSGFWTCGNEFNLNFDMCTQLIK